MRIEMDVPADKRLVVKDLLGNAAMFFMGGATVQVDVPEGYVADITDIPAPPEATEPPLHVWARYRLAQSDSGMIRVIEDVLAALIAKGVLALADLPAAARQKIQDRAAARADLAQP